MHVEPSGQSSRHQDCRNAEPVRLMKTCARAATRDHHTVLRIYFFSRHFLPNSFNRICCRHETAADHRARSWCHPGTADTLANHTRVLVCTQRSPPPGPRAGFAPASFARFLWRGSTFGGFASGCRIGTPLADVAARHPFATTPTQLGHRSGDRGPSRPQSGRTDKLAKAANLD